MEPGCLVASVIHRFGPEGQLDWQGAVVAEPKPGLYLVELFELIVEEPSCQRLIRVEDMVDWHFF